MQDLPVVLPELLEPRNVPDHSQLADSDLAMNPLQAHQNAPALLQGALRILFAYL